MWRQPIDWCETSVIAYCGLGWSPEFCYSCFIFTLVQNLKTCNARGQKYPYFTLYPRANKTEKWARNEIILRSQVRWHRQITERLLWIVSFFCQMTIYQNRLAEFIELMLNMRQWHIGLYWKMSHAIKVWHSPWELGDDICLALLCYFGSVLSQNHLLEDHRVFRSWLWRITFIQLDCLDPLADCIYFSFCWDIQVTKVHFLLWLSQH